MPFCDVILPGPWWNCLTYETALPVEPGRRVLVPVGRGQRIGIVGRSRESPPENEAYAIRNVRELLDEGPLLSPRLFSLMEWSGRAFLCGTGEILQIALPSRILARTDPVTDLPPFAAPHLGRYEETVMYDCNDESRWGKLREALRGTEPFLALFPEQATAKAFWRDLPPELKESTMLWPSTGGKKLLDAWVAARQGKIRSVVGGPGSVFAPLRTIRTILVDEESSGAYSAYKWPYIHGRSIAGRRAKTEGASLVLSGRMPSSRLFLRETPSSQDRPSRENIRLVDIRKGFASESKGVEGMLPLSPVLLEESMKCMERGRVCLWILDRKGYSAEVACEECGSAVVCPECGSVMAWAEKQGTLRCSSCGTVRPFPRECPACRGHLLVGKRPGLEALLPVAQSLAGGNFPVVFWEEERSAGKKRIEELSKKMASGGVVVGTRGVLAACDRLDVGFVAWIDADAEARRVEFQARFTAFSMVWESLWRGNARNDRVVLLQSHRPGTGWQKGVLLGWTSFWKEELQERRAFSLPPFSFLVEIVLPSMEMKRSIMTQLEGNGLQTMDPEEGSPSFWVSVPSVGVLHTLLAPYFSIGNSRRGFPKIRVWID